MLWSDAHPVSDGWRFRETIVVDSTGLCAVHGDVELEGTGGDLRFRWAPPGDGTMARARLRRR